MKIESVRVVVSRALDPAGTAWFAEARQLIAADRAALARLFPAVGRKWEDVTAVYNYGDAAERRAVLRALPLLNLGPGAVPLVLDALRGNDTRLIAAAMGRYAAEHLPIDAWRQAVLKCVLLGIPLAWVAELDKRKDAELIRMMRTFAEERIAAGRPVPPDVQMIVPDLRADRD